MAKRTDLPDKIIALLKAEPTLNRKEIAARLGVSYQAAQKHLNRLIERQKAVKHSFTVTDVIGETHRKFWVTINTKHTPKKKGGMNDYQDRLCNQIHDLFRKPDPSTAGLVFDDVRIVLGGRFDIILTLYAKDPDAVGRFVTRYLRAHESVAETSTAWSLERSAPQGDSER